MKDILEETIRLCELAGEAILEIYHSNDEVEIATKTDNSPVTAADLAAHDVLFNPLAALLPGVPVLSEEGDMPSAQTRAQWRRYWIIDPLDGTKEFIQRNGEFTVNVALIDDGEPILGVVHVPVQKETYAGLAGQGAVKITPDGRSSIHVRSVAEARRQEQVEIMVSRVYGADKVVSLLDRMGDQLGTITTKSMGSSLKFCRVAEGLADLYPRLAPTAEWDTAAAQAVVEAAGGAVVDEQFNRLRYNQKESLLNPFFYVIGDKHFDWKSALQQ
ncbi:MAG: 3'(2'),5'-bisphosphate nucleotidase CysQ [Cellvibrionaceae bacterium]